MPGNGRTMDGNRSAARWTDANRVAVRAVLVARGQDATTDLLRNGILDPVAVPVLLADASFASHAALGDGCTPNLIATLELDETGSSAEASEPPQAGSPKDD